MHKAPADEAESSSHQHKKRKKAARACNHCQTAHLTCDDNRPCGRCVKRGLGETCQDGARKKAKYLRDIEDALVNAGKAVPTHFIHSPPNIDQTGTEGAAATEDGSGSSSSNKASGKRNSSSHPDGGSDEPARRLSGISPVQHDNSLGNGGHGMSMPSAQHPRHSTDSPVHYAKLNLPPSAPGSNIDVSPSIEVLPSDEAGSSNKGNNHHTQLPPNAYANPSTSLLNFETPVPSNQIQPFNFFNDLGLGGSNNSGGGGALNDFSGFGMTNNNSANLEYAVLSSMLQNSGFGNTSPLSFTDTLSGGNGGSNSNDHPSSTNAFYQGIFTGSEDYGQASYGFPPAAFENSSNNGGGISNSNNRSNSLIMMAQANRSPPSISSYLSPTVNTTDNSQNAMPSLQAPTNSFGALPIDHNWPTIASKLPNGNSNDVGQQHQHHSQQQHNTAHKSQHSPSYAQVIQPQIQPKPKPVVSSTGVMKVEDVYKHINKPYNYLEAYHALIRHLQSHFENKQSVLRIIRSLSIYRPSIIALHMPLTVDDEIFVERSFQRTLIELEKLISFSGTPTLVWRRTGEIVLVGTEFTLLSEWRREDLLSRDRFTALDSSTGSAVAATSGNTATGDEAAANKEKKPSKWKKRYIFEVFDQDSLVEYYESFAQHAFESSSATIMFTCSIVTPKGKKVPCTFGYNLKRDIFGLPQMIIGQFLPILTSADDSSE